MMILVIMMSILALIMSVGKMKEAEVLGKIRESETGYARIWNEEGNTYFQKLNLNANSVAVKITQANLDALAAGQWTTSDGRTLSFDGETRLGGIPWSHGPCMKFKSYLQSTGQL